MICPECGKTNVGRAAMDARFWRCRGCSAVWSGGTQAREVAPGPQTDQLTVSLDAHHDGVTYRPARDKGRLNAQTRRVYDAMVGGRWLTLAELAELTGDPEASVSARLRDLRKPKFGGHTVERRYVGHGLHEYRMTR